MTFKGFIDPPGPYATVDEWQIYLTDLESIEPRSDDVKELIAQAKAIIARLIGAPE